MSDYAEKRRIPAETIVAAGNSGSFPFAIQVLACLADDIIAMGAEPKL